MIKYACRTGCSALWGRCASARSFSRELNLVLLAQFLHSYAYFMTGIILVQYFSQNMGMDDVEASILYSIYGMLITFFGVVAGLIADQVSVFTGLIWGAVLAGIGRVLCVVALPLLPTVGWLASALVVVSISSTMPVGDALISKMTLIGIKRYSRASLARLARGELYRTSSGRIYSLDDETDEESTAERASLPTEAVKDSMTLEYTLNYVVMNVAALLAYGTIVLVGQLLPGAYATSNAVVVACAVPPLVVVVVLGIVGWRSDPYDINLAVAHNVEDTFIDESLAEEEYTSGCWRLVERLRPRWFSLRFVQGETGRLFARYLVLVLILIPPKTIFRHLEATLPKYTQRAFYGDYPYALVNLINPLMIIAFSSAVQGALARFHALPVIVAGTAICALSVFVALVPYSWAMFVFLVIFSVGEIVWGPRLTEYVFRLAPAGHEGAFAAISDLPVFFSKLPVGIMSGQLLEAFCPASVPLRSTEEAGGLFGSSALGTGCNPVPLWGIIAAVPVLTPLLLMACYRWITAVERERTARDHKIVRVGPQSDEEFTDLDEPSYSSSADGQSFARRRPASPAGTYGA